MTLHIHFPRWLVSAKLWLLNHLTHLKVIWSIWDLRTFILVSLCFQIILILLAPFRKRTSNFWIISAVWLAYLLADYVATQAISLVPRYNAAATAPAHAPHADLLSFWSPFLLVHLGGPDTITALALEDNELWMRTALHLCTQTSATGRVFFQSLPTNLLWLPTLLMFIAGILKYLERTSSLFYARLTKFKSSMMPEPNPGTNYARLVQTYEERLKSPFPMALTSTSPPRRFTDYDFIIDIDTSDGEDDDKNPNAKCKWPSCFEKLKKKKKKKKAEDKGRLSNMQMLWDASKFFEKYKGLYVDLIFSNYDRDESRSYFLMRTPDEAFTVLETELNFAYEVFFTKMLVIHRKFGTIIRIVSVVCQLLSLLVWILFIDKEPFHRFDIRITYALRGGAIVIDAIAFLRILLSDWNIALLKTDSGLRASLYAKLLSARNGKSWPWFRRIFFRRWSESVMQFNLLNYCVDDWSGVAQFFFKILPIKDKLDSMTYVSKTWLTNELRDFIFNEIRYKSEFASEIKKGEKISDSRGEWIFRASATMGFDPFDLYAWTMDVEYDESLLTWHVATELLYQCEVEEEDDERKKESKGPNHRDHCKILSDYTMYLLTQRPGMMSKVAGISEVRMRDTCAEASVFFKMVQLNATPEKSKKVLQQIACKRIMEVNTRTKPRNIKGDASKSVLFEACRLAKELIELKKDAEKTGMEIWEFIAKVWVELLCYSASHCRADAHAAQLRQGGELLTLVWLLMVHLGLGKQFRIAQRHATSKLVIKK